MHYRQGKELLDRGLPEAAQAQFTQGYAAGDPKCAYGLLAVCAIKNTPREAALSRLAQSIPQLRQAAADGDGEALFILGRCAETGSVLRQNIAEAMTYYQKAANRGNADAMFNLGCIFMQTGEVGIETALHWYRSAAALGHPYALAALAHWEEAPHEMQLPPTV